jgi:hypothetical protein
MAYRDYSFYRKLFRRWKRKHGGAIRSRAFETTRGYLETGADTQSTTGAKKNSGIWHLEEVYNSIYTASLSLYPFTSFTFTHGLWAIYSHGGGQNRRQNTQSTASLEDSLSDFLGQYDTATHSWLNDTSYYNVVTAGIQEWKAPSTGTYRITVAGAAGGVSTSYHNGGAGAVITYDIDLTEGQVYKMLVGKKGEYTKASKNAGAGGGGGTFFFSNVTDTYPIIAAGGGGGACKQQAGVNASTSTSGNNGNGGSITGSALGGVNGYAPSPFNSSDGNYDAGGGAGWLNGNGEVNSSANDASFGYAPRFGGRGGKRSADAADDWGGHGGFGGGGGGCTENGNGYSGGGKGSNNSTYGGGGGGGSYYSGGTLVSATANNTGHGYITIQKI